jgi:hypothetical protein
MEKPRYLKGYRLDDKKIKKRYPPGEGDEYDLIISRVVYSNP